MDFGSAMIPFLLALAVEGRHVGIVGIVDGRIVEHIAGLVLPRKRHLVTAKLGTKERKDDLAPRRNHELRKALEERLLTAAFFRHLD